MKLSTALVAQKSDANMKNHTDRKCNMLNLVEGYGRERERDHINIE